MSDWDLSLCHCLPLSWENAAKVLRFVLGEKKGSPLPWRTKTHISSVLLFFSPAAANLPVKGIKRMKTWPVMAPHCSCCSYCCTACVNAYNMRVCVCVLLYGKGKKNQTQMASLSAHVCCECMAVNISEHVWGTGSETSDAHIGEMFVMFPTGVRDALSELHRNPYGSCLKKSSFDVQTFKPLYFISNNYAASWNIAHSLELFFRFCLGHKHLCILVGR